MAFLFMAISLPYSNTRVMQAITKALEVLFVSVGMVFTLLMLKVAVAPYASSDAVFSSLVAFRDATRCFLSSPLYICVAINFMIVLIALSSTFHRQENDPRNLNVKTNLVDDAIILESPPPAPPRNISATAPPPPPPPLTKKRHSDEKETLPDDIEGALGSEVHEIEKPLNSLDSSPLDSVDSIVKENLVPTYVGEEFIDTENQSNQEEDSIEATWNAITGKGAQKPKKKQLKKSETWDVPPRNTTTMHRLDSEEILPTTLRWKELRKSETFNDAVSIRSRGGLIRRDPSMTREEFNQQVEAFIRKFNADMRLQRQESHQRFLEMINNRGP